TMDMRWSILILSLLGLSSTMSIYEAFYPDNPSEPYQGQTSQDEAATERALQFEIVPWKRSLDIPPFQLLQMARRRKCKGSSVFRINC
ncbi:hypothetical protein PENTCL1PPCAC_6135, partial [Pristionchus entomophagus]